MKKVLNKRSNDTSGGYAKSPTTNNLEYGEIAVNYHDGVEKLFIKNDYNQIVSFPTDEQVTASLNEKQDVINDLSTIRSGAALGATAVQTETDPTVPSWAKQSSKPSYSYDEITGTEEKKTNQEFVYRQSPTTIKAKTVSLDRIYGKTLAWNQHLVPEDVREQLGLTMTYDSETKLFHYSGTATENGNGPTTSWTGNKFPNGHKVLLRVTKASGTYSSQTAYFSDQYNSPRMHISLSGGDDIITIGSSEFSIPQILELRQGDIIDAYYYVMEFDLTLLYGSDIDGLTDAEIINKFQSEFPGNYPTNNGTLISNDAESIETVGFNQWDEEWENGYWDTDNGTPHINNSYIRSKNPICVYPNTTYKIKCSAIVVFLWYDINGDYIEFDVDGSYSASGNIYASPSNARYLRFYPYVVYGPVYKHDICVNLSDPVKNGTYEPYKKSTMQLGLDSIKVKSHNIWDEEWEIRILANNKHLYSKNLIPVTHGQTYYFYSPSWGVIVNTYDSNKNLIAEHVAGGSANATYTIPNNVYYLSFRSYYDTVDAHSEVYTNDVCINVSSSFNGQYEPHGDITITGGLKSAGSVRDEIVENKFIKRVSFVDLGTLEYNTSWYNENEGYRIYSTITDKANGARNIIYPIGVTVSGDNECRNKIAICGNGGANLIYIGDNHTHSTVQDFINSLSSVYAYYELKTPIEYELVSPLVPTVKAGTTEARISPNSDGLSAPMVCDMTYDVDCEYILGEVNNKLGDIESILETI